MNIHNDATQSDGVETTAGLVADALSKWNALTGSVRNQTSFNWSQLGLRDMNNAMEEALDLDPAGTTTYLLLECFLRRYLEAKTFTAAEIMKDYAANSAYLKQAEDLFSVVQSDFATEIAADFRTRVKNGVRSYGADRDEVIDVIDDPDILPFLRRDALHSIAHLETFQFMAGPGDPAPAQVIEHVYIAWNINDLLLAVRDMPVSGIAVVLLRDPCKTDRSHFVFAMRNGGNVTLITDKSRPAYPGQEDVMRGRGGRGASRSFETREWANHFPYQLIKTSVDEESGDLTFDKETAPVAAGLDMAPLMRIADLPPYQIVWLTMMLALVSDKFWKAGWQAEEIAYTGQMVIKKDLLVSDEHVAHLPAVQSYVALGLKDLTLADVSADNVTDVLGLKRTDRPVMNKWLEDRYASRVPDDVLNLWQTNDKTIFVLPKVFYEMQNKPAGFDLTDGAIVAVDADEEKRKPHWERKGGYSLQTLSPLSFGTEKDLREDRVYIGRANLAKFIQREADIEFLQRKEEITRWYKKAVLRNSEALIQRAARQDKNDRILTFGDSNGEDFRWGYTFGGENCLTEYRHPFYPCAINDTKPTYRALFLPETAQDLAELTGQTIEDLPDVLQHWIRQRQSSGNHILRRLDPVENILEDPWRKLPLAVNVFLSKRGLAQAKKKNDAMMAGEKP